MEKEKKGLFRRLLDFWREKTDMNTREHIGFWNEMGQEEKLFAELGAVFSVSQQETKKTFWEETADAAFERKETGDLVFGNQERANPVLKDREDGDAVLGRKKNPVLEEAEKEDIWRKQEKADVAGGKGSMFSADFFREEPKKTNSIFGGESPEKSRETRKIISVTADRPKGKEPVLEEQVPKQEEIRKKEVQAEPVIDIEKLMRQMTEKLWEEREGCGRRFR